MVHKLRVFALLLVPLPVVFALLALAPHLITMDNATRDTLAIPSILVTAYSIGCFVLALAVAVAEAMRRGGRAGFRLRMLASPLAFCAVPYWLNIFLWSAAPQLAPALGVAALTLIPPVALLAFAAYVERHPAATSIQPANS
ncbi:MAG TPA: hypothetical protein VGP82_24780 [Ktedonobacterales bacterium]|jgi:hypothetical protein|nr:hypothetical protein [Ktedonobacterales bacterium]